MTIPRDGQILGYSGKAATRRFPTLPKSPTRPLRIGLLGLGTAAWLIAAMVLVERGIRGQGAAEVIPATIERCHTAKRAA